MNYLSVAQAAYITAFFATTSLLCILIFQSLTQHWKRLLVVGVAGQLLWVGSRAYSYFFPTNISELLYFELLRMLLWLVCLGLFMAKHTPFVLWPIKSKAFAGCTLFFIGFCALAIPNSHSSAFTINLMLLLLSICALVFTEQVVRNLNTHRMMKIFGLSLTFLFAYDVIYYGYNLISLSVPSWFLQVRVALAFAIAAALTVGTLIFNEKNDSHYLFAVSRPAFFFSTAGLFSILLVVLVSLGSLFVRHQGFLGTYLYSLAMLGIFLLVASLIMSRSFRQNFEVFVSKHFFSLKYDYRIEWLNAIRQLSELNVGQSNYYSAVLSIIRRAVRCNKGSLWINTGAELTEISKTLTLRNKPHTIDVSEPFVRTMVKESWIYAPQSRSKSLSKNNHLLPPWLAEDEQIWLIVPLIIQTRLVAVVILSQPTASSDITFEDRDLLTNISAQVASNILLHQQERVISDAKQMETYNRLSAFIMHDINNVIAQLALIGKNAERHRTNPAFIDDMIKTVHNATARMQTLIQKFNPASKEEPSAFLVGELVEELERACASYKPIPTFAVHHNFHIKADKQRLVLALKNLVRNAQDATEDSGFVSITIGKLHGVPAIVIEDSGKGMTPDFINEELFKPFSTTKDENGVGIGAYLTKSYIEHIGGVLNVKSREGLGTRFEITFDLGGA